MIVNATDRAGGSVGRRDFNRYRPPAVSCQRSVGL